MAGRALLIVAVSIVLAGFYLLVAGEVSLSEIIAGAPVTAAATGFAVLLHRTQSRRLSLRGPWPRLIGRPLAALFPDATRVGLVLLRALRRRPNGPMGVIDRQPFRQGDESPSDAGRRGLVTLALSLAPNGYVVSIPEAADALVLHRLAPAAAEREREWPA